jgi:hypothetical protein
MACQDCLIRELVLVLALQDYLIRELVLVLALLDFQVREQDEAVSRVQYTAAYWCLYYLL